MNKQEFTREFIVPLPILPLFYHSDLLICRGNDCTLEITRYITLKVMFFFWVARNEHFRKQAMESENEQEVMIKDIE